ncbi:MAG: NrfD/PsrC family molybdoenzyme membrane anchor subunit [Aureliella sp.]
MADRDSDFGAPWAAELQHRPDPNRVGHLQVPSSELSRSASSSQPTSLASGNAAAADQLSTGRALSVPARSPAAEPSYYDISMLQAPVWRWQIATYFFLGGLSTGAYVLSRAAARLGGPQHKPIEKTGTWIAFLTMLPCPALLIDDLGDPKRFHHMLRVFKPSSPMNLGSFALTGYGAAATAAAARRLLESKPNDQSSYDSSKGRIEDRRSEETSRAISRRPEPNENALAYCLSFHDWAGVPMAVLVAGYTGVLLSCTSNPLWCKNKWIGPLFSASAVSTGAEAVRLLLDLRNEPAGLEEPGRDVLMQVDTAAHVVEAVCLVGFAQSAGEKARPLTSGSMRRVHQIAIGALVASEVIKRLPVPPRWRRPVRMLAAATGLAAGFAMRWSYVHGGIEAANDPELARMVGRNPAN